MGTVPLISFTNVFVSGLAVLLTLKTVSGPISFAKFSSVNFQSANRQTDQNEWISLTNDMRIEKLNR